MTSRSEAEENLRVIRSLMERATFYRAISAPGALLGGTLALVTSFMDGNWLSLVGYGPTSDVGTHLNLWLGLFTTRWIAVLLITAAVNFIFLWRDAKRREDPFISPGMKLALRAVLPSYTVATWWTWSYGLTTNPEVLVPVWVICHGLALLATSHFAPRSLIWLGWAFLIAGIILINPVIEDGFTAHSGFAGVREHTLKAQMWMACTFGLFHLVYALFAWPRKQAVQDLGAMP